MNVEVLAQTAAQNSVPAGPTGPGGTGAGLVGPKGGYRPPSFGNIHNRDRADPDFDNEGSQSQHPMFGYPMGAMRAGLGASGGGFKLAQDAACITFKRADWSAASEGLSPGKWYGKGNRGARLGEHAKSMIGLTGAGALMGGAVPSEDMGSGARMGLGTSLGASAGAVGTHVLADAIMRRLGVPHGRGRAIAQVAAMGAGAFGGGYLGGQMGHDWDKTAHDMPSFTAQNRPAKVKEIYSAIKREHPEYSAGKKARIASSKGAAAICSNNLLDALAYVVDTAEKQAAEAVPQPSLGLFGQPTTPAHAEVAPMDANRFRLDHQVPGFMHDLLQRTQQSPQGPPRVPQMTGQPQPPESPGGLKPTPWSSPPEQLPMPKETAPAPTQPQGQAKPSQPTQPAGQMHPPTTPSEQPGAMKPSAPLPSQPSHNLGASKPNSTGFQVGTAR